MAGTARRIMGFEGKIYIGTANGSANTEIDTQDQAYNITVNKETTFKRPSGASNAAPIGYDDVLSLQAEVTFTMFRKSTDANMTTLLAAAYSADPDVNVISLRTEEISGGKGIYGDFTLQVNNGRAIQGNATYEFTATPTDCYRDLVGLNVAGP